MNLCHTQKQTHKTHFPHLVQPITAMLQYLHMYYMKGLHPVTTDYKEVKDRDALPAAHTAHTVYFVLQS